MDRSVGWVLCLSIAAGFAHIASAAPPDQTRQISPALVGEIKRPARTQRHIGGMAYIPAGEFYMGCNPKLDKECEDDESPGHKVTLDAFFIDRTEVRQGDYRRCVDAGTCSEPGSSGSECNWVHNDRESHPVNCVDIAQARAYCEWVGKRLPTEAQWEKAARGTDGRTYPWGNTVPSGARPPVANFADEARKRSDPGITWSLGGYDDGHVPTAPVGSYPAGASPYGVHDMAGNVWEWVSDFHDSDYYKNTPKRNPQGPPTGSRHAIRGGSFGAALVYVRTSSRDSDPPDQDGDHIGFRCAKDN